MSFIQIEFVYFLPVVFGVWLLVRGHYPMALAWLLAASLFFYGFKQWWILPIILGLLLGRLADRDLDAEDPPQAARVDAGRWLQSSGLELLEVHAARRRDFGRTGRLERASFNEVPSGNWVVPIGISFYAFTGIAYMVDVYRGVDRS